MTAEREEKRKAEGRNGRKQSGSVFFCWRDQPDIHQKFLFLSSFTTSALDLVSGGGVTSLWKPDDEQDLTAVQSEKRTCFERSYFQGEECRADIGEYNAEWGGVGVSLPPALSCSFSCQQTKLPQIQLVYADWRFSLWNVGKHNTHLHDWHFYLVASVKVAERRTVLTPTPGALEDAWLKGCFTGERRPIHVWLHSAPVTGARCHISAGGCQCPTQMEMYRSAERHHQHDLCHCQLMFPSPSKTWSHDAIGSGGSLGRRFGSCSIPVFIHTALCEGLVVEVGKTTGANKQPCFKM